MRKGLKSVIFSLIFCIGISQLAPVKASAQWNPPTAPQCNAVYLVNKDTGTVIYEKNQDQKIYPASVTKIMTAVLAYEKFKNNLDQTVTVEKEDIAPLYGTFASLVPLKIGEQLSIKELLYCLLIRSGDDSANVLARATGGSVDNFVEMMNKKAKALGLKNTHYENPHGLHNPNHYTTAYDCSLLAEYAMKYDVLAKIVDSATFTLPATNKSPARKFSNTNFVINPNYKVSYYKYVKGIKTGTTTPAGACLVSYAEKDGVTYYCVAMGGRKTATENTAFAATKELYKWVFDNFEIAPIVKTTDTSAQINVGLAANKSTLLLSPQKQLNTLVPTTYKSSNLKIKLNIPKTVNAPIKKGQVIGNEVISLLDPATKKLQKLGKVNLVATEDVAMSKPLYVLSLIKKFFNSIWFKVVAVVLVLLLILYITLSVYYNQRKKKLNKRRSKKFTYKRR